MAKFKAMLPLAEIKQMEYLEKNAEKMMGEMTEAGAKKVYDNIKINMRRAFKDSSTLEEYLLVTKVYKNSKGAIGNKVGFAGYKPLKNR